MEFGIIVLEHGTSPVSLQVTIMLVNTEFQSNDEMRSDEINRSGIIGLDGLDDLNFVLVKKYLDEHPDCLKSVFQSVSPYARERELCKDIREIRDDLYGEIETEKVVSHATIQIHLKLNGVPLDRFGSNIRQRTSITKKYLNP